MGKTLIHGTSNQNDPSQIVPLLLGTDGRVLLSATSPGLVTVDPADTLEHGQQTTNAGTAIQLAVDQACREVRVTAKPANTGDVYVGGSTVAAASNGGTLGAGDAIVLAVSNLNLVWIDVSVNGEGVDYLYLV